MLAGVSENVTGTPVLPPMLSVLAMVKVAPRLSTAANREKSKMTISAALRLGRGAEKHPTHNIDTHNKPAAVMAEVIASNVTTESEFESAQTNLGRIPAGNRKAWSLLLAADVNARVEAAPGISAKKEPWSDGIAALFLAGPNMLKTMGVTRGKAKFGSRPIALPLPFVLSANSNVAAFAMGIEELPLLLWLLLAAAA